MSESKTGEKHPMFGKHPSEATRQKISNWNKGKKMSEESKIKISISQKENGCFLGENNPKAVINMEIARDIRKNEEKLTRKQLAEKYGVSLSAINYVINNKTWIENI